MSEGKRNKKSNLYTKDIVDLGYNSELIKVLAAINDFKDDPYGRHFLVLYSP